MRSFEQQSRETQVAFMASNLHNNRWIPHRPTLKQAEFLYLPDREALFGGAAGGGKSDGLLMGALQFVDHPNYSAILFRRTFADLDLPGALIPRSHEWLRGSGARWIDSRKQWRFPSGATLQFGYLEHENDIYRYQSSNYDFIGFDELTQFSEQQWLYLTGSRMRRLTDSLVPSRARGATNPGGAGHQWVSMRFVMPGARWPYVQSLLDDNPYLDKENYEKSLSELDAVTYEQLRNGRWITDPRRRPFDMEWWRGRNRYNAADLNVVGRWLSYDTAVKTAEHNAMTARCVFELTPDYRGALRDVWKDRVPGVNLPEIIAAHAIEWNRDGKLLGIIIEDQSSGSTAIQGLQQRGDWISKLVIPFNPAPFGDKLFQRPQNAALWCNRDCIVLPNPSESTPWLHEFEQDLSMFPHIEFKDPIDAFNQWILYYENYLAVGWRGRVGLA